jgi:hypothetical protein
LQVALHGYCHLLSPGKQNVAASHRAVSLFVNHKTPYGIMKDEYKTRLN